MRRLWLSCPTALALFAVLSLVPELALAQAEVAPPTEVKFYGNPRSPISGGVVIPEGTALVWTSGTVAPVVNDRAESGTRERYGDTKIQAVGILRRIEDQLREQGLDLSDVVYLRAYVAPDLLNDGKFDFAGWNAAYGEFFGTASNPTKPARSTVGVAALVSPDFLIEVEAFAAYK